MKRRTVLALAAAVALSSCGTDVPGEVVDGTDSLGTIEVTLPSGRVVECVTLSNGYSGGLWCTPGEPS